MCASDVRLVPAALACWAATAWGMTQAPGAAVGAALGCGVVVALLLALVAARRDGGPGSLASQGTGVYERDEAPRATAPTPAMALLRAGPWAMALALAAVALLAVAWRAAVVAEHPVAVAAEKGDQAEMVLEIAGEPRPIAGGRGRGARLVVDAVAVRSTIGRESFGGRVPMVLFAAAGPAWDEVTVGSTVRIRVALSAGHPGEPVVARSRGQPLDVEPPRGLLAVIDEVRRAFRAVCQGLPGAQAGLVPALVIGDVSGIDEEMKEDFRATALTHLTAVSGSNLTILLAFASVAARWAGVRGWWLRGLAVVTVGLFVVLCRMEPSVLRAGAMGLVGLAALGGGQRGPGGLRYLCVAMVALTLGYPPLASSIGFALSVLASAGILVFARRWATWLRRWLPGWVAEAIAVPLAAQLATQPVVTWLSGEVSAVGLIANAVAAPVVGPATVVGLVACLLAWPLPGLAALIVSGAGWCAAWIVQVAAWGAALPGARQMWPATPANLALLAGLCLVGALAMVWVLPVWWRALAAAALLVGICVSAPSTPGWPPPGWLMVFCDVGQGDGVVLNAGDGVAVVIDAGPDPPAIDRCLDQLRVHEVMVLVVTHAHVDHYGGVSGVAEGRTVQRVVTSPLSADPGAAPRAGLAHEVETWSVGTTEQLGRVRLDVIGPAAGLGPPLQGDAEESAAENDASLILRAEIDGVSVLLTGDVEPAGQAALVRAGVDLQVDVLKVPHHGSSRQDPGFLAATGAREAVAQAGKGNPFGHPAARTIDALQRAGARVWRNDVHGSVAIAGQHGSLVVVTQR